MTLKNVRCNVSPDGHIRWPSARVIVKRWEKLTVGKRENME